MIKYPVDKYNTVNLYVLSRIVGKSIDFDFSHHIITSRYEFLKYFIDSVKYKNDILNNYFTISSASATKNEANQWFTNKLNTGIFVTNNLTDTMDQNELIYSHDTFNNPDYGFKKLYSSRINIDSTIYGDYSSFQLGSLINLVALPSEIK